MSESLGPLFTVEGAVVDARGRLKNLAYVEFITKFNAESRDRSQHPFPASPGLRAEESSELAQLRCWEDKKGAGWVAQGQGKSAWFSLSSWGSWRLALLLAKLQRDLWQRGAQEHPAGEAEGPSPKRPRKSSQSSTPKAEAKGGARGKGRPKNEETPSTEAQKPTEQPEKKDENAKVRRGPGRPKKDTPKEVPSSSKAQGPLVQEQKDKEQKDEAVKVHRGPGRPKKETPKEVPLSSEPHGPTEKSPERNDEEDREDPKASARARLAAAGEEDLPQLVAEGLLVNLVRAKGWHLIFNPKWEGDRWRKMLQDLHSNDFSLDELHQEVRQKLRRQATGQKLANSRLHRERAEQRRRHQDSAPQPSPPAPPSWRAPERVPGCTCGRPIHAERCRLFRPRMRPEEEARSRARKPQRPEGPAATVRAVPSPMTAAQRKVLKLENYIKSQPKALQKTLWKRALLRYHPDKALAQSEASEPKSAEVFIEVKRKYDLFVSG